MAAAPATQPASDQEHRPSAEFEGARSTVAKAFDRAERPPPPRADFLGGQYLVRMNTPLPELNTAFAKAYAVQDEKDHARALYALVCDPKMPVRSNAVKALLGVAIPHMVSLLAAASTELSGINARRLVLVYERPRGSALASILAERAKPFPESFISEHVVAPLGAIIDQLSDLGLCHGRINPNNIFFADEITLGECISEPCGYSQPFLFEVPERAQAAPAGKGESAPPQDVYALGVLAAYLRMGAHFAEARTSAEAHIGRALGTGSYDTLTRNIDFSDGMTDLLRGTLHDNPHERWTWEEINLWTRGRRFNMLPPGAPSAGSRPFFIGNESFNHLRDLAQGLYMHWDLTGKLLLEGTLIRWVDLTTGRKDVAEHLRRAVATLAAASSRGLNPAQVDEMITRCLIILDPLAPISVPGLRVHVMGLGTLLADLMRLEANDKIQALLEIINLGLANLWADLQKRKEDQLPVDFTSMLWKLDRARVVLRAQGLGFGLERVLYDLNPDLGCQSPLLGGHYAANVREMLTILERAAATRFRGEAPMDRHIAAFIASKLNLNRPPELSELHDLPKFGKHKAFVTLRLLEQAQEASGLSALPNLTLWVAYHLLEATDHFHSASLRKQAFIGIEQLAPKGHLRPLVELLNQRAFADMDLGGYNDAVVSYFRMGEEIESYKTRTALRMRAAAVGNAAARQIAAIVLAGTVIFLAGRYLR